MGRPPLAEQTKPWARPCGSGTGSEGLAEAPQSWAEPGAAFPGDRRLVAGPRGDTWEEGWAWLHPVGLYADLGHRAASQAGEEDPGGMEGRAGDWPHPSLAPCLTGLVSHVLQQRDLT